MEEEEKEKMEDGRNSNCRGVAKIFLKRGGGGGTIKINWPHPFC